MYGESQVVLDVGIGRTRPFNRIARGVMRDFGRGEIKHIPLLEDRGCRYWNGNVAGPLRLPNAGCDWEFRDVTVQVTLCLRQLDIFGPGV